MNPYEEIPPLQEMKQMAYSRSFARRMNAPIAPLLPVDADIAVHAEELERNARLQRNQRNRPLEETK